MGKHLGKFVQLAIVAFFALGPLPASADRTVTYAGTVSSVDGAKGSFVLQDVGPWRGGKPDASITNRRIVLTPETKFAMAARTWDGTSTFPGDYAEMAAQPSDLKEGAFVSVECQPSGERCRAVKLVMVRTDQPA